MLVYLFGLPAAGKNYVGEILAEEFGFHFHDADCDLTAEMHEAIQLGQSFTEAMRDRFYDVVIERIEELTAVHENIAVAQATFKEKHRNRILERFPEALMVLIEADEAIRVERLQRGNNLVTADYARQIARHYEPPICACKVLENNDGRQPVVEQLTELLENGLGDGQLWTVEAYLALETNHLVEYVHGRLEFLTMPTLVHQLIVGNVFRRLDTFVGKNRLGTALFAPLPVQLEADEYREPDIMFFSVDHPERIQDRYPKGADLIMEVMGDNLEDRQRDLVTKRTTYARAGIAEYWLVDLQEKAVTVLRLNGDEYAEHGRFSSGMVATSVFLPGFAVPIDEVFA